MRAEEKGRWEALGLGLYRRAAVAYKEGGAGHGDYLPYGRFPSGAVDRRLAIGVAPLTGQGKENTRRRKEGKVRH